MLGGKIKNCIVPNCYHYLWSLLHKPIYNISQAHTWIRKGLCATLWSLLKTVHRVHQNRRHSALFVMFCCFCSTPVDALNRVCPSCGRRLPSVPGDTPPPPATSTAPPASHRIWSPRVREDLVSTASSVLCMHVHHYALSICQPLTLLRLVIMCPAMNDENITSRVR